MSETAQRAGHIPGAASIPWAQTVKEDGTFKSAEDLATLYEAKGVTPDKDVIAYCRIGERSSHSWFVLHELLGLQPGPQLRRVVDRVRQPDRRPDREAGAGHRRLRRQAASRRHSLGPLATGRLRSSPVSGHDLEQPVVGEGVGGDAVPPDHRLGGDEGVDDRLLGRLDRRVEQGVDDDVADRPHVVGEELRLILVFARAADSRSRMR